MKENNEQLAREKEQHTQAFKKFKDACDLQRKKNDGSNTPFARHWKKYVFEDLINGLSMEIDNPDIYVRSSQATEAVKRCLGIPLVKKKRMDTGEVERVRANQKNYFDLELCAFVALQMVLDNALAFKNESHIIDKKTGKLKNCKGQRNRDALITEIGNRIEQQIYFKYVDSIFPEFFKSASERCAGGKNDMPRSSSYYWRHNMINAIKHKKEKLIEEGNSNQAELLDWRPFQRMQKKHIGQWLVAGCLKYSMLFDEKIIRDKSSQQVYVVLSKHAEAKREEYFNSHQPFIWEDLPMVCLPVEATKLHYGSWLTTIEQSKPDTYKGYLQISQTTLDYINKLQSVAYKINPFIASVMDLLYENNMKLGKFNPHQYVEPMSVNKRLMLDHITDREEQTRQVVNHPDYRKARREKSREEARQVKILERSIKAREVYLSMLKLRDYPELYFPYSWDFRGRAYSRCTSSPSPQGPDFSKALLRFAIERPVDHRTKHYLSIELANNAGMDKVNFDERLKWTKNHEKQIILVATMMDDTGDLSGALAFLDSIKNESPWQFIAAAEEYYHLFIKGDRKTTSIRCGMDMSCSGAGLMAGIRRCKTGAMLVNVYPTDEPQDLYKACWDALVKLNRDTKPYPPINPQLLHHWTQKKYGRAASKRMIMVAQYSAGIQKQMMEFYDYHDELPEAEQMSKDDIRSLRKLWPLAMEQVCSFGFVVDWFQSRAQEIYDSGKKEIVIPTPTGSVQKMFYPIYRRELVKSFHHGELKYTRLSDYHPTEEPDIKKWLSSITANAIHSLDGSILAIGLKDFEESFSTVHDAVYTYAGECMDDILTRLRQSYVETVSFDLWTAFLEANDLPTDNPETYPPIVGNLDLNKVLESDYIFA